MLTLYAGVNGQGKTILLQKRINSALSKGEIVATNMKKIPYTKYSEERIRLLTNFELTERIFDFVQFELINNQIVALDTDDLNWKYSNQFMELLNIICSQGDILVLDEPDAELSDIEIRHLIGLIDLIRNTYKEIYLATHNKKMFSLADKVFWVENYQKKEISIVELYLNTDII